MASYDPEKHDALTMDEYEDYVEDGLPDAQIVRCNQIARVIASMRIYSIRMRIIKIMQTVYILLVVLSVFVCRSIQLNLSETSTAISMKSGPW